MKEVSCPQLGGITKPLSKIPFLKDYYIRICVCVLVKGGD